MTVAELIAELQKMNPDAEAHLCAREHGTFGSKSWEIGLVYASTATYGVLLPEPRTVPTVVLDTDTCEY